MKSKRTKNEDAPLSVFPVTLQERNVQLGEQVKEMSTRIGQLQAREQELCTVLRLKVCPHLDSDIIFCRLLTEY